MPTLRQLRAELDRISAISGEDSLIAYAIWSEPVLRETIYGTPGIPQYPDEGLARDATPEQFAEIVELFHDSDDGESGLSYPALKCAVRTVCFGEEARKP